jgi:hypothetical protein
VNTGTDWLAEARKIVADLRVEQLRMLYGTADRGRAAEIEAARMTESARRKAARQARVDRKAQDRGVGLFQIRERQAGGDAILDVNDDGTPFWESDLRVNRQSGATGLFQFMSGDWR